MYYKVIDKLILAINCDIINYFQTFMLCILEKLRTKIQKGFSAFVLFLRFSTVLKTKIEGSSFTCSNENNLK